MSKTNIIKKFKEEYLVLSNYKESVDEANKFYNSFLKKKKTFKFNDQEKKTIMAYYDTLLEYNKALNKFLGNQKYDKYIKETDDEELKTIISIMKNNLIDNGMLIDEYLTIIKSQPSLFMQYFDGRVEKYGTYDKDINNQYKNATGYADSENYSLSDFYRWVTNQKIIGESLVHFLDLMEKKYNLKFGEINKGLFDSLFIGYKNWKLITPNAYTFDTLDQSNVIKGSLAYECGTEIKDGYKTFYVPDTVDTLVLHNPYNKKEVDTFKSAANDMNVVLSFFGYVTDNDYQEKMDLYNKLVKDMKSDENNKVFTYSKSRNKQYIKSFISIKK